MNHDGKTVIVTFGNPDVVGIAGDPRTTVHYPVRTQDHLAAVMASAAKQGGTPTAEQVLAMQPLKTSLDRGSESPMFGTAAVMREVVGKMLDGTRKSTLELTWRERQAILAILERVEDEDDEDVAFGTVDALDLIDKVRWDDLGYGWKVDLGSDVLHVQVQR